MQCLSLVTWCCFEWHGLDIGWGDDHQNEKKIWTILFSSWHQSCVIAFIIIIIVITFIILHLFFFLRPHIDLMSLLKYSISSLTMQFYHLLPRIQHPEISPSPFHAWHDKNCNNNSTIPCMPNLSSPHNHLIISVQCLSI